MQYTKAALITSDSELQQVLIANLSELGYIGFEETDSALIAYIPSDEFDSEQLDEVANYHKLSVTIEDVKDQNWNAAWESNFEHVLVEGFCLVRADFHDIKVNVPYEIVITPKMSFGTGHHATTQLMMQGMKDIDFSSKSVFDFGTGTGILAILAQKLGANDVLAVDNDEWSYENATENIEKNKAENVTIKKGSIEDVEPDTHFDVILANINRNILVTYMKELVALTEKGGTVLLSGLLTDDEMLVKNEAIEAGLEYIETKKLNNWITIKLKKP